MTHRGAMDADGKTSNESGVLTQLPHKLYQTWLDENKLTLKNGPTDLGVAMCFLPRRNKT